MQKFIFDGFLNEMEKIAFVKGLSKTLTRVVAPTTTRSKLKPSKGLLQAFNIGPESARVAKAVKGTHAQTLQRRGIRFADMK